jgi:hypothetical protein
MVMVERAPDSVSVADVWNFSFQTGAAREAVVRAMNLKVLPDFWEERIAGRG